ncbi:MAG: phosphotransferase enzyme family protein [Thermoanaerobaculia bacterium]
MKTDPGCLVRAAGAFAFPGKPVALAPWGNGHINETWAVALEGGSARRAILQRINTEVFRDPEALMTNVTRVTRHLTAKLAGAPDASRRALTLIPAKSGSDLHRDGEGRVFRAYSFIEGARSWDILTSPSQAREAAKAFGTFQRLLADLPPPRLFETIPRFHDTPQRLVRFREGVAMDTRNRAADVAQEIAFVEERTTLAGSLSAAVQAGLLPERVTHNDTKLNNVLLDDVTGEGICVIDLDTVMPGLLLHDFGDMVRTAANPVAEDERDTSKVVASIPMFEALVRGYLEAMGRTLSAIERDRLVLSGKLLTYECGMRFLTDHLEGDVYFCIHREGQNLDRARTQFALVRSLEEHEETLTRLVEKIAAFAP